MKRFHLRGGSSTSVSFAFESSQSFRAILFLQHLVDFDIPSNAAPCLATVFSNPLSLEFQALSERGNDLKRLPQHQSANEMSASIW